MKPHFFFDYIFYRMTKWYYKWDGSQGQTAALGVTLIQLMILVNVLVTVQQLFFEDFKGDQLPKPVTFGVAVLVFLACGLNERKYKKSFQTLDEHWGNETTRQRIFKGTLVIVSLLAPFALFFLISKM